MDDPPNADLEHAAEELGAVGDDPAHVDDQLLLNDRLPFIMGVALGIDNVLNHSWRQRVRDHLFFVPKGTQGYLPL